ncbi:DUF6308 family protein [Streptomyces sp. NPDC127077]|uniref:DUF6308 family protein n=1 Tax=Streptomyces sp. NPDC127077 TaxID=3347131 RepID=UPI00365E3374
MPSKPDKRRGIPTPFTPGASMVSAGLAPQLRSFLTNARAVTDLRRYFGIELPPDTMPFTGSHFEHLAAGGDRPEIANIITAEDLIAVETLSVSIPIQRKLDFLEGSLGDQLSNLLTKIPTDVDLASVETTVIADDSPADQAWDLLETQHGLGWVTAGKILARKRPRLLPVYDRVVRCALGRPPSFWLSLHAALREDDSALHHSLLDLRQTAGLPETVSALRVCDVAVWMGHRALGHACR